MGGGLESCCVGLVYYKFNVLTATGLKVLHIFVDGL